MDGPRRVQGEPVESCAQGWWRWDLATAAGEGSRGAELELGAEVVGIVVVIIEPAPEAEQGEHVFADRREQGGDVVVGRGRQAAKARPGVRVVRRSREHSITQERVDVPVQGERGVKSLHKGDRGAAGALAALGSAQLDPPLARHPSLPFEDHAEADRERFGRELWMLRFGLDLHYPVPPLRTIWYPTHVPLSFLAYAVWAAAAAAALVWTQRREAAWLRRVERLGLAGFGLWSLSMICGGIWGVVAWGAYFLWDPKVVWSVILWFHYASFVHVRFTPSLRARPWVTAALAVVGFAWVLVAYVGTSFFFGKSSHAF